MRRVGPLLIAVALVATGCRATTATMMMSSPPAVDISGQWSGTWKGYDFQGIARSEDATADFRQQGARGTGRFVMHTAGGAAGVPENVRNAGLTGVRVEFEVSGSEVVIRHERAGYFFTADFRVEGDRMLGYLRDAKPAVSVVLTRVPVPVKSAAAPVVAAPPAPAPAPPPEPVAPEPPKPPEPIAAAPAPPPEPAPAEPARPAPKEFVWIAEVKPIYFTFDKYDIRPDDAKILEANAEWLKTNPEMLLLIEGHCDERGTAEYNLALGERRAQATRNYLISSGVADERISIVSFGAERAVCTEETEECWSKNRRAASLVKPR
jgi:peptidoglycan-associated lipoprotein